MALFPQLVFEDLVQENDKLRLDASSSFAAGTTALTVIEIKPTKLDSLINITTDGYIDWAYEFKIDIDALNNKIDFDEGAGPLVATIANGSYSIAAFATALQTALNLAGGNTYTVSGAGDRLTIESDAAFDLLLGTGASVAVSFASEMGLTPAADSTAITSYVGAVITEFTKTVTVKVTNATGNTSKDFSIQVISETADKLFSNDGKLSSHEPELYRFLAPGKSSFKSLHRRAQSLLLAYLDTNGYIDIYQNKYTKAAIVDVSEVTEWATFIALRVLFEGLSNAKDDIWHEKASRYESMEKISRDRAALRLDVDGDGEIDEAEAIDISSPVVLRR